MSESFTIKTLAHLRPLLVAYRKKAGLSQSAIAQKLGITQQSYAELEARPESASFERLFRIFNMLNVEFSLLEQTSNKVSLSAPLASDKQEAIRRGQGRPLTTLNSSKRNMAVVIAKQSVNTAQPLSMKKKSDKSIVAPLGFVKATSRSKKGSW